MTLFVSEIEIEDKTRRMYSMLSPADFTDGRRARVAAESVRRGLSLSESEFYNAFDRHIGQVAAPLEGALMLCRDAELAVLAAGSGPGFFSPTPFDELPDLLLRELDRDWGVHAIDCSSLSRAEATAIREV